MVFETLTTPAPPDAILGVAEAFKADSHPQKVNLSVGIYKTNEGNSHVYQCVRDVERKLIENDSFNHDYLPIDGLPALREASQKLIFGADFSGIKEKRIATIQCLSGTGGLRLMSDILARHSAVPAVYLSKPTWSNHHGIFLEMNHKIIEYPYWDAQRNNIDREGLFDSIGSAPEGSVIVLHACAHNPTGMDLKDADWEKLIQIISKRKLFPLFDSAYQGFASGGLDRDAAAIRKFAAAGLQFAVVQSFAKNLGMYGERLGCLHVLCENSAKAEIVLSHLKINARRLWSSPTAMGAKIATAVLTDEEMLKKWKTELYEVAQRIIKMRQELRAALEARKTPGTWEHITEQIGMFSYTGLSPIECQRLVEKWHIYLLNSGRISMAGINSSNVQYVAEAIDEVCRFNRSHM